MILKVGTTQRYSEKCHFPYVFYPLLSFTPCLSRQVSNLCIYLYLSLFFFLHGVYFLVPLVYVVGSLLEKLLHFAFFTSQFLGNH